MSQRYSLSQSQVWGQYTTISLQRPFASQTMEPAYSQPGIPGENPISLGSPIGKAYAWNESIAERKEKLHLGQKTSHQHKERAQDTITCHSQQMLQSTVQTKILLFPGNSSVLSAKSATSYFLRMLLLQFLDFVLMEGLSRMSTVLEIFQELRCISLGCFCFLGLIPRPAGIFFCQCFLSAFSYCSRLAFKAAPITILNQL